MRFAEPPSPVVAVHARVEGHTELALDETWELASCAPDEHSDPAMLDELAWLPAKVPGTAAGALRDAGRWRAGERSELDEADWWFRIRFDAAPAEGCEEVVLELDGVATVAEVFLNGVRIAVGESMFAAYAIDVGDILSGENELAIRCRALAPLLRQRRKPRARWRTRLVDGNLRFFRTMLLGRAPGFAPSPAAVGPWRPVRLVRRRVVVVEELRLRPRLLSDRDDPAGLLWAHVRLRCLDGAAIEAATIELSGASGTHRAELALEHDVGDCIAAGTLRVPDVEPWWPHTHGKPAMYDVFLRIATSAGARTVELGRTGFRTLSPGSAPGHEIETDGLDLHVNGERIFLRGAVWTPADAVSLAPDRAVLEATLERARDAGMNMLRIPGTSVYESRTFHDMCDDLGLLLWQDFMFANLDYPISDEGFRATVEHEARALLGEVAGRPSLAVLCGNSEVEQQVAMLGLDPRLGRGELFGELLPRLVADAETDASYVPSSPCGGTLPFRPETGIANYYGVGGYRRPLEDARRAEVRFAAECLAFSNVPDEIGVAQVLPDEPGEIVVHHPRWKAGVPRDGGSGWDFEDVRDHYLALLYGVDPGELRRTDHERYLELSRAVTGEAMAEVFGEWRRTASPCGGGLVLWLADLVPGAGWGILDHQGRPKPAYHHLRRALAPVTVWTTDEGLGGICAHVANDRATPLRARLRIALYRDGEFLVAEADEAVELAAHGACERDAESLLGHFTDVSWAYRFGPPAHDVVVASLEGGATEPIEPVAQAFRFPAGRPLRQQAAAELGLTGTVSPSEDGAFELALDSKRVAYGVRVHVSGFMPSDDALTLEPGHRRTLRLSPDRFATEGQNESELVPGGALTALNMRGRVRLAAQEPSA